MKINLLAVYCQPIYGIILCSRGITRRYPFPVVRQPIHPPTDPWACPPTHPNPCHNRFRRTLKWNQCITIYINYLHVLQNFIKLLHLQFISNYITACYKCINKIWIYLFQVKNLYTVGKNQKNWYKFVWPLMSCYVEIGDSAMKWNCLFSVIIPFIRAWHLEKTINKNSQFTPKII